MASNSKRPFIEGTFDATSNELDWPEIDERNPYMRLTLGFGTGTVQLLESYDDGTTWNVVESYTGDVSKLITKGSPHYVYTVKCTVHSGDITYHLSN